jgi:hypothetical protein
LTGLNYYVLQIKIKIVSCHTADSKPVKQEVNGTVILPPLVFPVEILKKIFFLLSLDEWLTGSINVLQKPVCN